MKKKADSFKGTDQQYTLDPGAATLLNWTPSQRVRLECAEMQESCLFQRNNMTLLFFWIWWQDLKNALQSEPMHCNLMKNEVNWTVLHLRRGTHWRRTCFPKTNHCHLYRFCSENSKLHFACFGELGEPGSILFSHHLMHLCSQLLWRKAQIAN